MLEGRLVHWCRIETGEATTGTADTFGKYTTQKTYASSKCLFSVGKGGVKRLESGERVQDLPAVILPATTTIEEGVVLEGLSTGFLRAYVVRQVRPIWTRALHHIRCDIEAVT